jgi:WD40 repeat protein/serine/threonine protein kinase
MGTVVPRADFVNVAHSDAHPNGHHDNTSRQRFRIIRPHAQGGLGKVSVAKDLELNREVAFKEIRVQYADDASARARFVLEAEVTGGLEHPSIVPVYAMGSFPDGRPYYAMRFIKGQSLQEVVDHFHTPTSSATTSDERSIALRGLLQRFIAVCQAIEYAHSRDILHRDIKPANIMLGSYGETLVVDWGLAKPIGKKEISPSLPHLSDPPIAESLLPASRGSVEQTRMGTTVGTLHYMGPEQASGRIDLIGPAADIYSLGATLYYILTGRSSVKGKSTAEVLRTIQSGAIVPPSTVLPGVPKALDAICMKAMAVKPEDRYESAQAMAKDLERWLADEPVSVLTESTIDRTARWLRRNRAWFRAVAIATATIILVLSLSIVLINRQRNIANHQRGLAENLAEEKSELAARETELRKQAQWQAASRSFEQSILRCEQLDPAQGVLSIAQNLKEAQAIGAKDLEYSIRAQLGRWEGALNTLDSTNLFSDAIRGLLLSPDGNKLLVATNGPTSMMDVKTGKMIASTLSDTGRTTAMAFCTNTERFITAGEDRTVRFWDTKKGESIGEPISVEQPVVSLSLTSDERVLATASGSMIRLWNVESMVPDEEPLDHPGTITDIAFCVDSPLLVVADWEGNVHVWNIETKQIVGAPWEHGSSVLDVAISPDGKTAATCELDHRARLWDISTGKQIGSSLNHSGMVGQACFSSDGSRLVTGCVDQMARVWDVATGDLDRSTLHHASIVNAVIFEEDDQYIWTGCGDNGLRRWRVANGRSTNLPLGKNGNVVATKFDDSGKTLSTISAAVVAGSFVLPGERSTFALPSGDVLGEPLLGDRWLEVASFSPNNQLVATACSERAVQIWNVKSGEPASSEFELASAAKCLAFSPDQSMLLVGTEAGDIHLWNLSTGGPLRAPIQLGQRISACAFFPNNERFIVGCWDEKARIYQINDDWQRPLVERSENSLVTAVGVHPAGTMYFTGTADGSIRLWDADTNEQIGHVMKRGSRIKTALFTADGGAIMASYFDGSARQWDVRTGLEIGPPLRQTKEIMAMDLSDDGEWLATASADWTARLWRIGPAQGTPEMIQKRYERLTNMEQLGDGSLRTFTTEQWQQRQ